MNVKESWEAFNRKLPYDEGKGPVIYAFIIVGLAVSLLRAGFEEGYILRQQKKIPILSADAREAQSLREEFSKPVTLDQYLTQFSNPVVLSNQITRASQYHKFIKNRNVRDTLSDYHNITESIEYARKRRGRSLDNSFFFFFTGLGLSLLDRRYKRRDANEE